MSTEQPNEDGKIDVQINFHRLPFAPIIDFKEGDNAADSVRDVMDRWLAALVGETPASMPEMELWPEIVQNVLNATGVDLSHYTVTDVQYNAPSVFNITLR